MSVGQSLKNFLRFRGGEDPLLPGPGGQPHNDAINIVSQTSEGASSPDTFRNNISTSPTSWFLSSSIISHTKV